MIGEVMKHINNYFVVAIQEIDFVVSDGAVNLPFLQDGQYYLVSGSVFNDGVHKYGESDLVDEDEIHVKVYALAPPKAFLDLVEEISTWSTNNQSGAYTSESFGGYSYTKATNEDGMPCGWKDVFKSKLNDWRKLK